MPIAAAAAAMGGSLMMRGPSPLSPVARRTTAQRSSAPRTAASSHLRVDSAEQVIAVAPGVVPGKRGLLALAALAAISPKPANAGPACEDFTTGEGGIQFCDYTVGSGNSPVKGALIRCHYTGRLASNNSVFDSSYNRGLPLQFKVGVREVIAGWDMGILGGEGIPPMKEGGKRRLVIPSNLAYGERSVGGGLIPANSDLIFDVELLPPRRR
eukprot:jgi/Tetstr1/423866/TSEL_014490.t1